MRILYIGSFRLPNFDAAAARVLNNARALRVAGHDVSFISWGGEQRKEDLCEDGVYRVDGFPYVVTDELDHSGGLIEKVKGWARRGNKTLSLLNENKGTYDAIILYGEDGVGRLMRFCEKESIPMVSDLTEWRSYDEMRWFQRPFFNYTMRCILPRVKNKILISSYLNRYYCKTHNIIIPAICDSSEKKWHLGKEKALERAGKFDGVTLIYAGTPARKDALHYVIVAVNQLINEGAQLRLLILGCEKDMYMSRFKDLLPRKDLSERIQFLGRVPQDVVPSFYSIADFMILIREINRKSNAGFPTKFSESFTSGVPVIANLTSDLGCYLKNGETGFVVDEPSKEAVYKTIKNQVLTLNRLSIEQMKQIVNKEASKLDYHYFAESIDLFIKNLS